MEFAEFATHYSLPARDRAQARAAPARVSALATARFRWRNERGQLPRRLAYLDSTFPWVRSGFRYHEARALFELAPETLFFSMWEMTDPFPAPVYPLAEFPRIAIEAGITDAYGVFVLFLAGLVGLRPSDQRAPHAMEGPDLWTFLRRSGIRLHGCIYPGGGLTTTPEGLAHVRRLAGRLTSSFSYVQEVIDNVPGVTAIDKAMTNVDFYVPSQGRWSRTEKTVCLFAADAPPRKGIDVALEAFAGLSAESVHLHVVGPHEHRASEVPRGIATFHGWLSPEELRELHERVHVFVSPVSAEPPGPSGSFRGVTDGFPTQSAADAMSSGCLLISANPSFDHRVLRPGQHYVECEAEPRSLRRVLTDIAPDRARMRGIADAGSEQVRARMNIRRAVASKLAHMGLS